MGEVKLKIVWYKRNKLQNQVDDKRVIHKNTELRMKEKKSGKKNGSKQI